MRKRLNQFHFSAYTFPLLLLLAAGLAYALLAGELGYYWDDWPFAWISRTYGAAGFTRYFSTNRPVWGLFYKASTALLGTEPTTWHLVAAFSRALTAVALWWALGQLWPGRKGLSSWVALLYLVYPGMAQQFVAIMHTNYDLVQVVFWLSIGLMGVALRKDDSKWRWLLPSLLLAALALFSTEYFFGLELLRPLLVWLALEGDLRARIKATVKVWWPYALLLAVYTYWRVFVFSFQTYAPETLQGIAGDPISTLGQLLMTVLRDVGNAGVVAWLRPLWRVSIDWASKTGWLNAAVIVASALGFFVYMCLYKPAEDEDRRPTLLSLVGVALVSLLLAGIPFWVPNLPVRLDYPNDRFTLPFIFGSSLLVVAGIYTLVRRESLRHALLALLAAFAIGYQFQVSVSFRQEWKYQQAMFQQLLWRAPAIEPGTTLVSLELPLTYVSDDSLTAPLNWIYAPDNHTQQMPYHLGYLNVRLGRSIPELEPNQPIYDDYLAATFAGNTSQLLAFSYQPPACLRIYDPVYDRNFPLLGAELRPAVALSDPQRLVRLQPQAELPAQVFKDQPDTEVWCYYFQKADLARQLGDWPQVAELGDKAFMLADSPNHATERIPFIEGYARTGQWAQALAQSYETYQINKFTDVMLCDLWGRVEANAALGEAGQAAVSEMYEAFSCK